MKRVMLTSSFVALLAASPAFAQGGTTAQPPVNQRSIEPSAATQQFTRQDTEFVNEAARAGMAEVELGQLAREKASSAEVKAFASGA